jgi:hypothetical protein
MTEEEAKTKTCCGPQVVAMMIGLASPNMAVEFVDNPGRCCASACMAWRVAHFSAHQENVYDQPERPDGDGWKPFTPGPKNRGWWRTIPARDVGFCGLAGRPE